MGFANIKFSGIVKILIVFLVGMILIRLIPAFIVVGLAAWVGFKGIKYLKRFGENKHKETVAHKSSVYDDKSKFDFSNENVVDVEYEEIRK